MDGQKITIQLAGKEFSMTAASPSMERYLRLAARDINSMLEEMNLAYDQASLDDKLSMLAIRQAVAKLIVQDELNELKEQIKILDDSLTAYLDSSK